MKLKAITKCYDDQTKTVVQEGDEFDCPQTQAESLIAIGAAIAVTEKHETKEKKKPPETAKT